MDTKLLDNGSQGESLGIEVLLSIASRQRRREFFYRSLFRCVVLTLLFIGFGCFLAIYAKEKGGSLRFYSSAPPFDLRNMLKELFVLSLLPSACFAVCSFFNGRLCRLCDTVFPALYGTLSGAFYYTEFSKLFASFSVSNAVKILPYVCGVLFIITVYTLFCPVCASFGECRRRNTVSPEDKSSCFKYFMSSYTALALIIILRDLSVLFFKIFD